MGKARWRSILPWLCLAVTAFLILLYAGPSHVGWAGPLAVCPTVPSTQNYTFVYGAVLLDSAPAPAGSIVEARNPRGNTVGCQAIERDGEYGLMYVYGEQTVAGTPIPGMRNGEIVAFRVDGSGATPVPVLTWSNDWNSHLVDLYGHKATPTSTPAYLPLILR